MNIGFIVLCTLATVGNTFLFVRNVNRIKSAKASLEALKEAKNGKTS